MPTTEYDISGKMREHAPLSTLDEPQDIVLPLPVTDNVGNGVIDPTRVPFSSRSF